MDRLFFCFVVVAGVFSCHNNETPNIESDLKLLWSLPLKEQSDIYKFVSIEDDVIYNNGIVIGSFENGVRSLSMVDLESKEIRWTWNGIKKASFDIEKQYQYDKYLIVNQSNNSYGINLDSGQTIFSIDRNNYIYDWTSGINETFFMAIQKDEISKEYELYMGNVKNANVNKIATPNFGLKYPTKHWGRPIDKIAVTIYKNDTLLVVPYVEPKLNGYTIPQFGTYNLTRKKWLYDNIEVVFDTTFYKTMPNGAKVFNDKVYIGCGNDLVCFDLITGKEIWRRNDFLHAFPFAFFGYEIYGNKLITHTQGGRTYAIDVNTGQNIWKLENVGDPNSFMHHYNGVLYYIAGGRLLCVDIENGQILASISSPDHDILQERVVVVPQANGAKAKVVIMSYKNMYVYEAIR